MNVLASTRFRYAALGACLCLLAACQKASAPAPEATASAASAAGGTGAAGAAGKDDADEGVKLSDDQVGKLGIETTEAQAATYTPEATGFALVVAHEAIAQALAELVSAQAVARQSHAALARIEHLKDTAGALPADAQESAARQAAVDDAALTLAHQRMSAAFGQNPPWRDSDASPLASLADGRVKLVRVTFPLGQLAGGAPKSVALAHMDTAGSTSRWTSSALWDAPADANVPGRSFFALLKGTDAGEGERLLAWAPVGAPQTGVLVPESATVISGGKYWCYVSPKPGVFVRTEVDTHRPLADGYFLHEGISAGDLIVTAAAGQLLAREMNGGAGSGD